MTKISYYHSKLSTTYAVLLFVIDCTHFAELHYYYSFFRVKGRFSCLQRSLHFGSNRLSGMILYGIYCIVQYQIAR